MTLDKRVKALEGNSPDNAAQDYVTRCIISRLSDSELDIMENAAKLREKGLSEDAIEKRMGADRWEEYQKCLEHFESIHADLDAASKRGVKITPVRW